MPLSRRSLLTCSLAMLSLLLASCGGGSGTGISTQTPPPSQGSLTITIMSLPSNAAASVAVTGPNGYSTQLTSSQTLQLTPGTYTVNANSVGTGATPLSRCSLPNVDGFDLDPGIGHRQLFDHHSQ